MSSKKGFSIRQSLESQGVTDEAALRGHISFVYQLMQASPSLEMSQYRVNPLAPNQVPPSIDMG